MFESNSINVIIPVRGGSKGIRNKNLLQIEGESLLARMIYKARASKYVDRVIVTTDNQLLIDEAIKHGAEVPFVRPADLARDETPGIEPILHAAGEVDDSDYIVALQVTSPLLLTSDIDNAIELVFSKNAPACVSVTKSDDHPNWMFKLEHDMKLLPLFHEPLIARRQDLPPVYILNGAIYIAQRTWLLRMKSFLSCDTVAFAIPKERSLDIDTPFDLSLLETYLRHKTIPD